MMIEEFEWLEAAFADKANDVPASVAMFQIRSSCASAACSREGEKWNVGKKYSPM